MNEVNVALETIRQARIISAPTANPQLRRIGEVTYAITSADESEPSYVFDSQRLSWFISEHAPVISGVSLVKVEHLIGNPKFEMRLELRLNDGRTATLDQSDGLYYAEPFAHQRSGGAIISPVKHWGLPAELPFARMMLCERMVKTLEDMSQPGQRGHLLTVLWKEYQLAAEDAEDPQAKLSIEGEFMGFTAKAFGHGLVLFCSGRSS